MAITAVATPVTASTGATTPRTITLSPDASTAPGDMVAVVANTTDVAASSMSLPATWAVLLSGQQAGTMRSSIWAKTWQPGDEIELAVSGTDGTVATVLTVKGAGPVIVGPVGVRAVTGSSTTNVAPGVAAAPGSLVLLYSGERTNSTEPEPAAAGFTTLAWRSGGIGPNAPAVSLLAAVRTADGPVPDTTITYPNSSAANGLAIMVAIGPATAPSGASVADVQVSARGAGHRRAHGASRTDVSVAPVGAGAKRTDGGQVSGVKVSAVGAGHRIASGQSVATPTVEPVGDGLARRAGHSTATTGVRAVGSGHARRGGGSLVAVLVEAVGARRERDDFELILGPGPVGSPFAIGGPVGNPFTVSTPRR
ncbi:hypothetical protein SAMN04487781_4006 [Cellulosimicrobium cellulans]|nr:hypothetical protein SAMN04487781_4006 [Cellulosimicrobium cellulans]